MRIGLDANRQLALGGRLRYFPVVMRTGYLDHAKTSEFELSQLESSQGKRTRTICSNAVHAQLARTGGVSTPAAGWVLSDIAD